MYTCGKCSKFRTLFSWSVLKMLVIKVRIQERPARIANREDPDQIASLEAV